MMNQLNDFELWHSMQADNEDALSQIYFRYFDQLYEYGFRHSHDEDVVKDKIHDLFVKIWVKRADLHPKTSIKSYLFTSLRNALTEQYRTSDLRNKILRLYHDEQDTVFSLDFDYIQKEQSVINREQLQAALNQLTPKQKELIYLRYFEDVPYEEIARIMGVQVKGVYKLSARAMEHLKMILKSTDSSVLFALISLKFIA